MRLELKSPLPGTQAQLEMAPAYRIPSFLDAIPEEAMESAVLVLLSPANGGGSREELLEWPVLLIRRNSYPGVHSDQISFPGGKRDPEDAGLWETACREGYEEVGVAPQCLEKIGPLTRIYIPPSNFVVYPFIAVNGCAPAISLDPREAVQYKQIPIKVFNPDNALSLQFSYESGPRPAPAWEYEDFTIWGATAMMLAELYRSVERGLLLRR
jgi:8-oxo-dGTP pyrophosphatase MutT (NUDIX family)